MERKTHRSFPRSRSLDLSNTIHLYCANVFALNETNHLKCVCFFFLFFLQVLYLDQLLACVDAVLQVSQVDCDVISVQLLKVLVCVQSLSSQQEQHNEVNTYAQHFHTISQFQKDELSVIRLSGRRLDETSVRGSESAGSVRVVQAAHD